MTLFPYTTLFRSVTEPIRYVEDFAKAGADILTVHVEACENLVETVDKIHACGMKAGVSIKPNTPVSALEPVLDKTEMFLIMSVEPGFGGQAFIPESLDKIRELKNLLDTREIQADIEVDGGIYHSNVKEVLDAGANVIVAGSAVFKGNVEENLKRVMENILTWTAQPDGQYDDLNTIYNSVRVQYLKYTLQVQKNLGGRYTKNVPDSKGRDYVPRSIQKEVVEWLGRNLFVAPLWLYPDEVVSRVGLKAVDEISDRQSSALALLLAPGMLHNIYSTSFSVPEPYSLDEYLNDVFVAVWKPLNDPNELENNFRRQTHRTYLSFVERVIKPNEKDNTSLNMTVTRSDIQLFMEKHLDKIEEHVKEQLATCKEGDMNYRHYSSLLRNIKKTKETYYGKDADV